MSKDKTKKKQQTDKQTSCTNEKFDTKEQEKKKEKNSRAIDEFNKVCLIIFLILIIGNIILVTFTFFNSIKIETELNSLTKKCNTQLQANDNSEAKIAEAETSKYKVTDETIETIFDVDGEIYKDENENTFYWDCDCRNAIRNSKNIRFAGGSGIWAYDSERNSIYCYLTEEGKIVYCPSNINVFLISE